MKGLVLVPIFVLALLPTTTWAAETVSLDQYRAQTQLREFLGSYLVGKNGGNDNATITIDAGHLYFWEAVGNIASASFSIPLNQLGKTVIERRRTSRGLADVEIKYSLEGKSLIILETIVGRFWKSVERQELRIEGAEMINRHQRNYFVRGLLSGFQWRPDQGFNGAKNTLNINRRLLKVSSTPIPSAVFIDMVRARPTTYYRLTGTQPVTADNLKGVFERGEYEVVVDDKPVTQPAKKNTATVIAFPGKKQCKTLLDPEGEED